MSNAAASRRASSTRRPFRRNSGKPRNRNSNRSIGPQSAERGRRGDAGGLSILTTADEKTPLEREMSLVNSPGHHRTFEAVATDGIPIAYEDLGRGEPLVLL